MAANVGVVFVRRRSPLKQILGSMLRAVKAGLIDYRLNTIIYGCDWLTILYYQVLVSRRLVVRLL